MREKKEEVEQGIQELRYCTVITGRTGGGHHAEEGGTGDLGAQVLYGWNR